MIEPQHITIVTGLSVWQDRRVFHVGDVIRKLRKQRGLHLRDLAATANMSMTTLSEIERGMGNQRRDTLERVATALGTNVGELYASVVSGLKQEVIDKHNLRSDDMGPTEPIDVSDYTKLDIPVIAEGEASPHGMFWNDEGVPIARAEEWMSRPGDVREKTAYAIVVRGDSMEPMLKRGYRIILSQARPVQEGDIVYAQLRSGDRLIKVAHKQNGGYVLESYNAAYAPRFVSGDDIIAIHKCVYIRTIS